jgi:protein TonB
MKRLWQGNLPAPLLVREVQMFRRWFVPLALVLLIAVPVATAHAQPVPTASGRVIEAADGDVVVVPSGARVSVVTRTQVQARLVYVAAQQTLLLVTDPAIGVRIGMPEAKSLRRWQVQHRWPLEPRWEGNATIDEYAPPSGPSGLAIRMDRGTILVGQVEERDGELIPPPLLIVPATMAISREVHGSFDEIEQAWLAGGDDALPGPRAGVQMRTTATGGAVVTPSSASGAAVPVRVGGNIREPTKTQSAEPVYPALARAAGVQGVVILEVTIGADGVVSDAQVLRSIPLLDQAALDAVRQWRYEPTLLNGVPTPVILTVTVNFVLPPSAP